MKHRIVTVLSLLLILCPGFGRGQDNLRREMFGETDSLKSTAESRGAAVYSPKAFARAGEYYKSASEAFSKGSRIEDIRENVKNAGLYFAKAIDGCVQAARIFNGVMIARDDARSAGAPVSVPELWKQAESEFSRGIGDLEDRDSAAAIRASGTIEQSYRAAELEAIKTTYLSPARGLLKQADERNVQDLAPATLTKARGLVENVERILRQNRRDADQARTMADEARSEAAHAIALAATIRTMKADDKNMENVILSYENQLARVATVLGVRSAFEKGPENAVADMIAAIKEINARLAAYADSIRRSAEQVAARENDITNLNQQISSMQSRLGTLTDNERELQRRLAVQHDQEMTVRNVSMMFTQEEGNVLREGENIILRLYGLTFASGKSDIEPQYYPLLTKVQDAIRRFPGSSVKIEGHTDSKGNERINQTLSEARAKAVAEYLMANMGVAVAIPSEGFGDTRPVASNNTPEGRARNRRIDVVLNPGWTSGGK